MTIIVLLRDVVDAMDVLNDEIHAYLNKLTGELVTVTTEDLSAIEEGDDWSDYPDWQRCCPRRRPAHQRFERLFRAAGQV